MRLIRILRNSLIIGLIITAFLGFNMINFINTIFWIGFVLIIVGAVAFLSEKGYFRIQSYGFKKIFKRNKKGKNNSDYLETEDEKLTFEEHLYRPLPKYLITYPYIIIGFLYFILSFALSMTLI
jgi:hypothetical protein